MIKALLPHTTKRNFGLDFVRAISIWLVLLQHAGVNIPYLAPLKIGTIGVEVFFVLSGFLIGGILFREIRKGENAIPTLKRFWIRRWFRILPLYYAVLLFKFIFIDDTIGWNLIYYLLFLQSNFYGIDFMVVSWSLVIEEWFYLFAPLFLILSVRWFKGDLKKVTVSILIFIAGVICFRSLNVFYRDISYSGINGNFIFRFDSLFLGVLLAWLKFKKDRIFFHLQSVKVFAIGLTSFLVYIYYFWTLCYPVNVINESFAPRALGFFILPLTIALMTPFASTIKNGPVSNWRGRLWTVTITWTSILTYGIYLVHPFVYSALLNREFTGSKITGMLLSILSTYLIAAIVYMFFENPILKYRDKVTRSSTYRKSIPPL